MATLNEGATSLAAANWSDATGFADNATLVINKPFGNGAAVTAGLDQSGLTTGIDSLDIKKGAAGIIGGSGTSLEVDADSASTDGISNHGNVTLYLQGGGSSLIQNFDCGANSRNYLTGGTFTTTTVQGGYLSANESTVLTNFDAYGGNGVIEYKSDKITLARIMRGSWIIKRACTSLIIGENATVIFDPDDAASFTSTAITNYGGRLIWRAGAVPTVTSIGGSIDFSEARDSFTPGSSAFTVGGTKITEGDGSVSLTNVTYVGRMQRSAGGFIPLP